MERYLQEPKEILASINEDDLGCLMYGVILAAAKFWDDCPGDFCLQHTDGCSLIFGSTNRVTWHPESGFQIHRGSCTKEFQEHYDALVEKKKDVKKEPRSIEPYEHDCEKCIWVGWIHVKGGGKFGSDWGNMYFCPNSSEHYDTDKRPGSVVIRFSDACSDYWSSPIGMGVKGSIGLR